MPYTTESKTGYQSTMSNLSEAIDDVAYAIADNEVPTDEDLQALIDQLNAATAAAAAMKSA